MNFLTGGNPGIDRASQNGQPVLEMLQTAFTAFFLVEIQSFNDGNGRTARLLMNPVLTRCESRSPLSFSITDESGQSDGWCRRTGVLCDRNRNLPRVVRHRSGQEDCTPPGTMGRPSGLGSEHLEETSFGPRSGANS